MSHHCLQSLCYVVTESKVSTYSIAADKRFADNTLRDAPVHSLGHRSVSPSILDLFSAFGDKYRNLPGTLTFPLCTCLTVTQTLQLRPLTLTQDAFHGNPLLPSLSTIQSLFLRALQAVKAIDLLSLSPHNLTKIDCFPDLAQYDKQEPAYPLHAQEVF